MVSSCLRKEGRNKDIGVAKEMGSGVGPEGGVTPSLSSSLSSSLAFSCKNAVLAYSSSNLFCEGRWSIASKSSSGWTFPSRLHTS